jgi:hypothetical protein
VNAEGFSFKPLRKEEVTGFSVLAKVDYRKKRLMSYTKALHVF